MTSNVGYNDTLIQIRRPNYTLHKIRTTKKTVIKMEKLIIPKYNYFPGHDQNCSNQRFIYVFLNDVITIKSKCKQNGKVIIYKCIRN